MQKIIPFLWFDDNAEEAAKFYTSVFKNSKIKKIGRYTKVGPGPEGSVMTVEFTLNGQDFVALNGGPNFKFTEAISLVVNCETQAEVDRYWKALTASGGKEVACGWLKDKYGLCWQITPTMLTKLITEKDRDKVDRVMTAMMGMVKLDIKKLKAAADAKPGKAKKTKSK